MINSLKQLEAKEKIEQLFLNRIANLEILKNSLSLKRYYAISEKINIEKEALKKLLDLQDNKDKILGEFSFILDPAYFEQKFIN